ncbi:hypothetical protein CcaverHIS631_0405350 [Cutaneotrichosporon cavernicola]|nr:hypothetical protein CcaverHIS631_0405350 [Cutaneotrichosporon cavernicola]
MSKKIDLSLFRGDDSGDEMDLLPLTRNPVELDPLKSRTFAHGVTKKTKKDLEREDEERKRAEEEAATQRALEEFSRTFDGPETGPSLPSLRGERSGGGRTFVRAGEATGISAAVPNIAADRERERERTADRFRLPSPPRAPKPRGKRAMDAFLEEIKSVSDSKIDYWYDNVPAKELLFLQDVSKRIREHGPGLLDTLKERERENPKFAFLFEKETAAYYVFQHLVNSRFSFPEPPPPSFNEEGYASAYSSDSDEREEMSSSRKAALGKLANRRLEAMLRSMSGKRVEIARAMEFALKRADAYDEVTQIICRSLCVEDTPIPRKIARLHLVSDILHNSSSTLPNVWRYRQSFETRLPNVFEHFAKIHSRLLEYSGTLSANVFIQQVDAVLDIWERWMVLTSEIQSQLRRLLHGECTLASLAEPQAPAEPELEAMPVIKSVGFKSSFKRVDPSTRAAAPSPVTTVAADLDGEPVEDLDGEPVDDIDGGVDGEPIDVDGEALDDADGDVDGEDMELDMDEE